VYAILILPFSSYYRYFAPKVTSHGCVNSNINEV